MKKKKILFVIESLACAGAEKSLTTLLNLMDYTKFDVDLQLFGYGGAFEKLLPKEVNLLPKLKYFEYCESLLINNKNFKIKYLLARLGYSMKIRTLKYENIGKSVLLWKKIKKCIEKNEIKYDYAIAYAQGVPTFYVADCVTAEKKYAWVNVTYIPQKKFKKFINQYYDRYNKIVCVSDMTLQQFKETFPDYKDNANVIYDINDEKMMIKMSKMQSDAKKDMKTDKKWKLLTVGRLSKQKGYDIAMEACKILKEQGISFMWYALGKGPLEDEIKNKIKEYQLEDNFKLLGVKENPYPYYKECDIYVQTSKFEGFGLALTEARVFNKPIVTTEFDAVYMQIKPNVNGLVTKMDGESIAESIMKIIEDENLRETIINNIKQEKKGNIEEYKKIQKLLEDR